MISIHLSDEELTIAAAGERVPRTAHHLQICADCQQHIEIYRERMASLRQDVCYSAARSAIDWGRQSRAIHQGILAAQMIGLADKAIAGKLVAHKDKLARGVEEKSKKLKSATS